MIDTFSLLIGAKRNHFSPELSLHFLDLSLNLGLQIWIELQALVGIFLRLGLSAQPQIRQAAISKGSKAATLVLVNDCSHWEAADFHQKISQQFWWEKTPCCLGTRELAESPKKFDFLD